MYVSMSGCLFLCLYLSFSVPTTLGICYLWGSLCLCLSLCLASTSVLVFLCADNTGDMLFMEVSLSICLSLCLSVRMYVCLSVCLSVRLCLSVLTTLEICCSWRSLFLSVCLSLYLSLCLSVCADNPGDVLFVDVYISVCLFVSVPDHKYRTNASHGEPIYFPAFVGSH